MTELKFLFIFKLPYIFGFGCVIESVHIFSQMEHIDKFNFQTNGLELFNVLYLDKFQLQTASLPQKCPETCHCKEKHL